MSRTCEARTSSVAVREQGLNAESLGLLNSMRNFDELDSFISRAVSATPKSPSSSISEFYQRFADNIPQKIPSSAQSIAMDAVAQQDPKGLGVLVLLNIRSIASGVDSFQEHFKGDRDEIMQAAITEVLANPPKPTNKATVPNQINKTVRAEVSRFIATRDGIPVEWFRKQEFDELIAQIDGIIDSGKLTKNGKVDESLCFKFARNLNLDEKDLFELIRFRSIYWDTDTTLDRGSIPPPAAPDIDSTINRIDLENSRKKRKRYAHKYANQILKLRFGSAGKPYTLDEIGEILGLSGTRIGQIIAEETWALRRL